MRNRPSWSVVALLASIVAFAFIGWYDYHSATVDLTCEQRQQMTALDVNLQKLAAGDFVSMKVPQAYVQEDGTIAWGHTYETRMVKQLDNFYGGVWLSGPAPMSTNKPGRFLQWRSNMLLRDLMNAETTVIHHDNPGWREMATWYYLQ